MRIAGILGAERHHNEIQQGDRVGIIGYNGVGKSTLLKILSRIPKPTTGKVHIKGRGASLLEVGTGFHSKMVRYITYPILEGM